ncbi:PREDICTED: probable histidine ammonia-lyase [Amphimedon queenslandica]|uniref:Histidine ammonia-lyase n=1 Tax=Amphimedon queenslandica TaxID=400682 RepID=A0A1X7UHL3_AMPQE|nr:PREDICTED: probable histidine ammonia-lyase [Amphimedon queenslandica]|eukprot:XP_011405074.2 PREDICTED: probable histidine ammonia-lyase [Amphimedon queenslandica]
MANNKDLTYLRVFVRVVAGGSTSIEPATSVELIEKDCDVKSLKIKVLGAEYNPDNYVFAFNMNGVIIPDDSSCKILKDDDYLLICQAEQLTQLCDTSPEHIDTSYFDICQLNAKDPERQIIELDGESLTCEDLLLVGLKKAKLKLSSKTIDNIKRSRHVVDDAVKNNKVVYGVSTGFGCFKNKVIKQDDICELQENLITSHATGVGPPLNRMRTRMLFALRINVIVKGYSGVRLDIIESMIETLNADCLPYVAEKGSVGASGDLAPLSHLILGLMGEGQMWSPKTGWGPAAQVLKANKREPITLKAKEGLALNNGTQMITALGTEAVCRAEMIAKQSEIIAAMTIEVLKGVPEQFAKDVHESRPHPGQLLSAERLSKLLHNKDGSVSTLIGSRQKNEEENPDKAKKVQDPYSLRCIPQVHGVVHQTIAFVKNIISTELNSATDNPLIMINRDVPGTASAGHFHGEYPGMAMDHLAIAVHELASISERRIERLVHPDYIAELGLPGFLVGGKEGLNNGFMIPHYTAAALVSENKVLTHPSTVDSITTSGGSEDHVSMGTYAARKALNVVENVENVLAIELLAACQALDCHRSLHTTEDLSPTDTLSKVYDLVRSHVKALGRDRFMSPDIVAVARLLQEGLVWKVVKGEISTFPTGLVSETRQYN